MSRFAGLHSGWAACALGLFLLCHGLAGCVSGPAKGSGFGSGGSADIEELHLLGVPVALKPSRTGPAEGFAVRVFASSRRTAKGMTIRQGTLDILMFDGALAGADPRTLQPARVWTYPAARLGAHAAESALGVGYQFVLSWEGTAPTKNRVTILARYVPLQGVPVFSAPSAIPVAGQ